MFEGALGVPSSGWPKKMQRLILKDRKPRRGRPGAMLPPVDFEDTALQLERKIGRRPAPTDVLSYLMYPEVFLKYARIEHAHGALDVLPTPAFFYGMKKGEEISVDLEPGKTLIIKFLATGDPHPDGTRTVFFELNGQPREVTLRDHSLGVKARAHPKADPANPGHVGAPIPGAVASIAVELNQRVDKGDKLLVMEAMKMQTTVQSPISGRVKERLVQTGMTVEPKDLLLVIDQSEPRP